MVAMIPVATVMTPALRIHPPLRFFFACAAVEPVAVRTAVEAARPFVRAGDDAGRNDAAASRCTRCARRETGVEGEEVMSVLLWSGFERSWRGPIVLESAKV
ncbi:hypothetical protein [Leifsonia soli]|uniref:Uncharacterized protein n=1 Tax=Leifsonia soli TaxID=582665 RepID=A0A852T0D2_9MICO|nr:hypothetical protein [Leifsonia soli]NYD74204.1 hypothetical protein [Leifsonia soli]